MFATKRIALLFLALFPICDAAAQTYPARSVHFIVGYSAGGGVDGLARIVGEKVGAHLGQSVVVENHPGASGAVAAVRAKNAPADGYTFLVADAAMLSGPVLNPNAAYDPKRDFTPVAALADSQLALVVNVSVPVRDVRELVAMLKAAPGKYSYATPGHATPHHLVAERLKRRAGVEMVHVPYKGGAPAIADIAGGVVPFGIASLTASAPLVAAKKVRMLAVTGAERAAAFPDVPTLAETFSDLRINASLYMLAPAGTPEDCIATLRDALKHALADERTVKALARNGFTPAAAEADVAVLLPAEVEQWSNMARALGAAAQ